MITRHAPSGAVAAANHLAAAAGAGMFDQGGTAVDAAIATAAVMAVTSPHMCGLGGDLFALVSSTAHPPAALNASGRAGSGADARRLRARGTEAMPFQRDIASVTVPGFVDGLVALHARYGRLPLGQLLEPARRLAEQGFPVSPTLARESTGLDPQTRAGAFGSSAPLVRGRRLRMPGVARALEAIASDGRDGFYEGEVGQALLATASGLFSPEDLAVSQADWVEALHLDAFGRRLWTVPPNSQGYLVLSGAWIADAVGVPTDPDDEAWAFTLVEAARQAAYDRVALLHEHADGTALLSPSRLKPRAAAVRERASVGLADVYGSGGTTYLCAIDRNRTGVSLIMSNGADFGSHLLVGGHGIFLHNRGAGFSLLEGHPAHYAPGARPPHTLSPLLVTGLDGTLDAVLGTMGGDAQPQIILQLLARTLICAQDPGEAIAAPRWYLSRDASNGFDVWASGEPPIVRLEHEAPSSWAEGLQRRGYTVAHSRPGDQNYGHAQMIGLDRDDMLSGAADPRSADGAFVGR